MAGPARPLTRPVGRAFSWRRLAREWLLETLLPVWLVLTFVGLFVGVRGESMEPTLREGEYLLVPKYERWLHAWGLGGLYLGRGDVVVFRPPPGSSYSQTPLSDLLGPLPLAGDLVRRLAPNATYRPYFVKRVVGLPGDTVSIRGEAILVNGRPLAEPYVKGPVASMEREPVLVPPGHVYVVGDNRLIGRSVDSRSFGPVSLRDVAGRVVFRVWPPGRVGQP